LLCTNGPRKTTTGKRKISEPFQSPKAPNAEPYDNLKFKSAFHQARYMELVEEMLWYEQVFNLSPEGAYNHIYQLFAKQEWGRLLQPPKKVNVELVREFYTNALPTLSTNPFTFQTFVRGRDISFTRDAINEYLVNPYHLAERDELCEFHATLAQGSFNYSEIERTIVKSGRHYDVSDAGRKHRAKYVDLTLPAQVILKLILHNIRPKSHILTTTVDVAALIYYILKGKKVDIARTITYDMKLVTLHGKSTKKCPLAFPGLIMGLIIATRMYLAPAIHEEIKIPIDDEFISRNMEKKKKKDKGSRASTSQNPQPQQEPPQVPTTQAFDFLTFVPWMN